MTTTVVPPSLQRTPSTGHLNIYLVVENKTNNDLIIISRENLPPSLRVGKLILRQKVTFRNEERQTVEGTIVYMNHNRDNCVIARNNLLHIKKKEQLVVAEGIASSPSHSCDSRIIISNVTSTNQTKKILDMTRKTKINQPNKRSTTASTTLLTDFDENEDINDLSSNSIEYSLASIEPTYIQQENVNMSLNETNETLSTMVDTNENKVYLDKINELSDKVLQQNNIIKSQAAEIKRLKSTMIEIPTDPGAQAYLISLGNKVKEQTMAFKYLGNLSKDASTLGVNINKLTEVLKLKGPITSTARELFKMIVPECDRQVDHWSDLQEGVLLKEQILIDFLQRYFGPIQADQKKIHTSLVGCLRNERNVQKRQNGQTARVEGDNNEIENGGQANVVEGLHSD